MKTSDFFYELPEELIAQDPLADRSASRLLCLDRQTGAVRHDHFRSIPSLLRSGDCLVLNDTKVLPARLYGTKADTGAAVEILLLKRLSDTDWECLVRPGRKCKHGTELLFTSQESTGEETEPDTGRLSAEPVLRGLVTEILEEGNRRIRFSFEGIFEEVLDRLGEMPLPPYIKHKLRDKDRYQTVYARAQGSAAAPTAGLHFTNELLKELEDRGVKIARVTLHVGLGTFRPVKAGEIHEHHMHSEYYEISREAAEIINGAKASGGRVICVGTTSCRTLETAADETGHLSSGSGWTDIFLYPGCTFKIMDGLITNFHLPESTLLMLVSAFAGREHALAAYREAVSERYRFYSFGDAMFIS